MTNTNRIPNPGSDAAIARGCICPVLDNEHGTDVLIASEQMFWVNSDCPVHITLLANVNPNTIYTDEA